MATPYSVIVLEEVASTQDEARRRVSRERPAVVVAHSQTGGRGRGGSAWETAPRAVAVSVGVVDETRAEFPTIVPLLAGIAARRVLGSGVTLKWPNDVMKGEAKVGGILVEAADDCFVAGLGLNLYWPAPPPGIGAVRESDPGAALGPMVAVRWAEELLGLSQQAEWPRSEYVAACSTLGRDITWLPSGRGRAVDVADDGSLVVVDDLGDMMNLFSGAVRHVRPDAGRTPDE